MLARSCALLFGLTAAAIAQAGKDTSPQPRRSMADGLVRQLIEREKLVPPRIASGVELGTGTGPMVLLIRKADGTLRLEELQRGGDRGPAATKQTPELPEEPRRPLPDAPAPRQAAGAATDFARLCLGRDGATTTLGPAEKPRQLAGKTIDAAALQALLKSQFDAARGTKFAQGIVFQVQSDVSMQDALTAWEIAYSVGFRLVMWEPSDKAKANEADKKLIHGLAAQFEWGTERLGNSPQPVCAGELLILLDGPARFGDISPLMYELASAGIWEFGFVGQPDARTRFKLPTHLPFDGGR